MSEEMSVNEAKIVARKRYKNPRYTDSMGVGVIVDEGCIVGSSEMGCYADGNEDAAWLDTARKIQPSPEDPKPTCYHTLMLGATHCPKCDRLPTPTGDQLAEGLPEVMLTDSGKYSVYIPCGIEIAECHDEDIANWIVKAWIASRKAQKAGKL